MLYSLGLYVVHHVLEVFFSVHEVGDALVLEVVDHFYLNLLKSNRSLLLRFSFDVCSDFLRRPIQVNRSKV